MDNPRTWVPAVVAAGLCALAAPAAADPVITVPDPSFAVTGAQDLAAATQGAATRFSDGAQADADAYQAQVQQTCPVAVPPDAAACGGAVVPATLANNLWLHAGALGADLVAAAGTFADSGVQGNLLAILATKEAEAQAVADALAQGLPNSGAAVATVLAAVNQHLCDTGTLDPEAQEQLCGAATFVGHARQGADDLYLGALAVLRTASLTPTCDAYNGALDQIGPAPDDPLPCASLPTGNDAADKAPPAP